MAIVFGLVRLSLIVKWSGNGCVSRFGLLRYSITARGMVALVSYVRETALMNMHASYNF